MLIRSYPAIVAISIIICSASLPARAADEAVPQPKPPVKITADTTWSEDTTVDSEVRVEKGVLTVAPGITVTFTGRGRITVMRGASLIAKGTAEKPVKLAGENCGRIIGYSAHIVLEHCEAKGVSAEQNTRWFFISASAGKKGIELRNCTFTDCGGIWVTLGGPFEMTGCDVRRTRPQLSLRVTGKGKATVTGCTFVFMSISMCSGAEAVVTDNVLFRGTLSSVKCASYLAERNYVHQPQAKRSFAALRLEGTMRNNVFRGGAWVSNNIGGQITSNVLISLPAKERRKLPGGFDVNCTHEHIAGLIPGSTVARNIFVGTSYAAVMGIPGGTCSDSTIRNNTIDMRGGGRAITLNHMIKSDTKNIVVRSNIFMRSHSFYDEKGIPDSCSYIDYNLWSDGPFKGERFWKVTMTGKEPGDEGFGGRDLPPKEGSFPAAKVVVNPEVEFPFSDDDMLARKHTVAEVLAAYREAYALAKDSPAVDAGDPADKDDPAVTDGKPDIGALEQAK